MVATTVTKEGRKIEAAIGKSMEKTYKANFDAGLGLKKNLQSRRSQTEIKETSALVASVVRSITPVIEKAVSTAITEAFQRGVADKSEALKSSMEASVVPAFEMSCKAMFDQDAINSSSSMTQILSGELADGQRKLVALALAGANSDPVNPLITQISNGPIGSFHDKMEAPLDPTKELSRLVYEHKYEEAFTAALQRSDVWIVSWLCSQVDLQGLLTSNPLPLSQGVTLYRCYQHWLRDISHDHIKETCMDDGRCGSYKAIRQHDSNARTPHI
ncbi:hypothetical protein Tco_1069104 [Tanacetum coccineum]|uniref:Uncharacterized protein n=1 Tax=Tanacetum coccineum TaxID=301880 RepID=A0ABQ5HJF5_9ASTR